MPMTEQLLAERVRWERERRRWSYGQVAAAVADAGHSLDRSSVMRIEKGARRVTVNDLMGLASAFGIEPSELLVSTDDVLTGRARRVADERVDAIRALALAAARYVLTGRELQELVSLDPEVLEYVENLAVAATKQPDGGAAALGQLVGIEHADPDRLDIAWLLDQLVIALDDYGYRRGSPDVAERVRARQAERVTFYRQFAAKKGAQRGER